MIWFLDFFGKLKVASFHIHLQEQVSQVNSCPSWKRVSREGRNFVQGLLTVDPELRQISRRRACRGVNISVRLSVMFPLYYGLATAGHLQINQFVVLPFLLLPGWTSRSAANTPGSLVQCLQPAPCCHQNRQKLQSRLIRMQAAFFCEYFRSMFRFHVHCSPPQNSVRELAEIGMPRV